MSIVWAAVCSISSYGASRLVKLFPTITQNTHKYYMHILQVSPMSVGLLSVLIPLMEPVGWSDPKPGTILGYSFTPKALMWIFISSALGLVVTLSTFLFIGATSSLT